MCRSACKRKGENDMPPLSGSWANALKGEFSKDYYKKLFQTVGAEYKTRTIYLFHKTVELFDKISDVF